MCSSCLFRSLGHCAIINICTSKVKSYALVLSHYLRRFYVWLYPSAFRCYFFRFCGLIRGSIPRYFASNSGIQPSNNFIWYLTVLIENAYYFCYYFLLPFFLIFLFFFFFLLLLVLIIFLFSQYFRVYGIFRDSKPIQSHKSMTNLFVSIFTWYYIYILINTTRFTLDYVCMSFAVIWIIGGNFRTRRVGGCNKQQ